MITLRNALPHVYSFRLSDNDDGKLRGLFEHFDIDLSGSFSPAFRVLLGSLYGLCMEKEAEVVKAAKAAELNERECPQCGKHFSPLLSAQRFCSRECYNKAHGVKAKALRVKRWKQ